MKLKEVRDNGTGVTEVDGIENEANLCLLDSPREGDFVLVHAGFAIEKLDESEARERIALFEELAEVAAQ